MSKGKGRSFKKKKMDKSVVAAYRCTWVFAINKLLSEFNERQAEAAAAKASAPASSSASEVKHPPPLTLTHLTPMVGMVPGHIHVSGGLMSVIERAYQKDMLQKSAAAAAASCVPSDEPEFDNDGEEEEEESAEPENDEAEEEEKDAPADSSPPPPPSSTGHSWHRLFDKNASFWWNQAKQRSCTSFSTDGIAISFHIELQVTKRIPNPKYIYKKGEGPCRKGKKRKRVLPDFPAAAAAPVLPSAPAPAARLDSDGDLEMQDVGSIERGVLPPPLPPLPLPPPPFVPFERSTSHLHYLENETQQSLVAKNIAGVLTPDLNRGNMFKAVYRPLYQLLQEDGADAAAAPAVDEHPFCIRICYSKRKYKHMRGIKKHRRVRDQLCKRRCAHIPQGYGNWVAPPSLKGTSPALIQEWKKWAEQTETHSGQKEEQGRMHACLQLHALHTFRRLRFESYTAEQKMWPRIQDDIYEQIARGIEREKKRLVKAGRVAEAALLLVPQNPRKTALLDRFPTAPRLLIALGDGSFRHNSAGHLSMPEGNTMFCAMREMGEHICWVDEFCTSKCCSTCSSDLAPALLVKKAPLPRVGHDHDRHPRYPAAAAPEHNNPFPRRHRKAHQPVPVHQLCRFPKPSTRLFGVEHVVFPALDKHRRLVPAEEDASEEDEDDPGPPDKGGSASASLISPPDASSSSSASVLVHHVVSPWRLRVCFSQQCRNRIWCRDINASLNMLLRVRWWLLYGTPGPSQLCRKRPDDQVAAAAAAALILPKPRRA